MPPVRIAILGATSHIAKGLIAAWGVSPERELYLYARDPGKVQNFTSLIGINEPLIFPVEEFGCAQCDVIVNCIGIAVPDKNAASWESVLSVTEVWDRRVLEFLALNPDALYINLSSGAAYGSEFAQPVCESSQAAFPVNGMTSSDYYGIAKLHAEARHRAAVGMNIVDLRVFSYFSRYIDLSARFMMADIISALKSGSELLTTPVNIIRDYVHPHDLVALMDLAIDRKNLNKVYDVYSRGPATKIEILDHFATKFGLRFKVVDDASLVSVTGNKEHYYSLNHRAAELGYEPAYASLDTLRMESTVLLQAHL